MVKLNECKRGALMAMLWTLGLISTAQAGEALVNGGFESVWTNGWTLGNPQNSYGNIQNQTATVSPFLNVDPAGMQAVKMTSGASSTTYSYGPSMYQYVTAPMTYVFSFEFYLPDAAVASPWEIGYEKSGSSVIDFMIGGAYGYGSGGAGHISYTTGAYTNYVDIASLTSGVWYQLTTVIDANQSVYSGMLTTFQGTSFSFSGTLQPRAYDGNIVIVGSTGPPGGSILYLDNVSIRTVPEPRVSFLLVVGLGAGWAARRRQQFLA